MISKESYVYIQLPHTHEVVTAGRLNWQKQESGDAIGTFVYGKKYLENKNSLALDEFNLPLDERKYECLTNEGIFGPIRDASPDRWGRYVIEKNTPNTEWNEIGYLLNGAEDRVGALMFGVGKVPPAPIRKFNQTVDLESLIEAAHKLEKDLPISETERAILMAGASMGGARPKTTVEHKHELWLAKFPSHNDRYNFAKIEYGTMLMAKDCGLRVPEIELIKIGTQDVFLIKRFDRQWSEKKQLYLKNHFVSGLTALNIDESDRERWSYLDLADQLRRWVRAPTESLKELFKRMVFNSLVSNTDDHPRNHGLIFTGKDYDLSGLYDVVPKLEIGTSRFSAMTVGAEGRIFTKKNVMSKCDVFGLSYADAETEYKKMSKKVSQWRNYFGQIKMSDGDLAYLENAFDWEGRY